MRNTEQYNNLSYVSFKIFPLCKYTLVPATVKCWKRFWKPFLWNNFQLFGRILNYFNNITKAPSVQYWFQSREQEKKNRLEPGKNIMGKFQCCHICFWLRSPWPKPTGVLEHCRGGETNWWVSIFLRRFLLTAFRRRPKDYSAHFFIHSRNSYKLY